MKKIFLLAAMMWAMVATAGVPSGYYRTLTGKSGRALKDAVCELTRKHTVLTYNSLWSYYPQTDCRLDDPRKVWDMYSNHTYYFPATVGWSASGMHREHSLPKSWWGGIENAAYTDINHLYPADGDANMAKSNYPLGEVSTATFDNGVTRVGRPVAGQGGGAATVFEPADEYKGDFARTYLYMATCYQDLNWRYTYMFNNANWLTLNPWSVDLLLKWARQDPVSDKERARNEAVYRCQNNRNPYIDNPSLMEYIWGNKAGQVFTDGGEVTGDPELITPVQDTKLNFGEVALGRSITLTLYVKGSNLTHSLSVTHYRGNPEMFATSVTSIDRTVACSPDGYPLSITYTPTAVGNHTTRLVISDGGLTGSIGAELSGSCLPVPALSGVHALPATDVTDSTYVAQWEPLGNEKIDYYIINRTVYSKNGTIISSDEFTTDDAEHTHYPFADRRSGEIHTYTVQSYRLGYASDESNTITLDWNGITGVQADKPIAFIPAQGMAVVKCSEPLGNVNIYNVSGALVQHHDTLSNDDCIYLPTGIYIVTTRHSTQATKLHIK